MRRRTYLSTTAAILTLTGCSTPGNNVTSPPETDADTPTETERTPTTETPQETTTEPTTTTTPEEPPSVAGYDIEEVRQEAEPVQYAALNRDIDKFRGEPIYYQYAQIYEINNATDPTQLRMTVSTAAGGWDGTVAATWSGEEKLEEDDFFMFWGVVEGLYEYNYAGDSTRMIPLITLVDYEFHEEE